MNEEMSEWLNDTLGKSLETTLLLVSQHLFCDCCHITNLLMMAVDFAGALEASKLALLCSQRTEAIVWILKQLPIFAGHSLEHQKRISINRQKAISSPNTLFVWKVTSA